MIINQSWDLSDLEECVKLNGGIKINSKLNIILKSIKHISKALTDITSIRVTKNTYKGLMLMDVSFE